MEYTTSDNQQNSIELTTRRKHVAVESNQKSVKQSIVRHESIKWASVTKSFLFASPFLGFNWTISETTGHKSKPAYSATVSIFSRTKPAIVLRSGNNSKGNILAVAYCRLYRPVHVGIGNPEMNADNVSWETMNGTSWTVTLSNEYSFEVDIGIDETDTGASQDQAVPQRRKLSWLKTSDPADGVDGWNAKLALRNYKLVDREDNKVLAIFLAKPLWSLKGTGQLYFFTDVEDNVEIAAVVTIASILLKWRRRE